ncbi:peptidase M28, partial [Candidatus Bathyarchaeota archaeon]|nr:peptidase M28 [Candidatus Bathyarchaeota archaeon]
IVIEVDIAGDVPGIKPSEAPTKMGKGPSLCTYDSSMIPNQPLKEFVIKTAREAGIPLQLSQVARGGTDAGRIHLNRAGCPSVVIGIPTRHIHSHVGMLSLIDVENAVKLMIELVKRLDADNVNSFISI